MCLSGENKGCRHPLSCMQEAIFMHHFFPISCKNKEDAVGLGVGLGFGGVLFASSPPPHDINVNLVKRVLSGNRRPDIAS